jgi:hypothetical protein
VFSAFNQMKNCISLSVNNIFRNAVEAFSFLLWNIWRNVMYLLLIISCSVSVFTYISGQANSNICTTYCRGKFDPTTGHEDPEGDSFINLGVRWVANATPRLFYSRETESVPIVQEAWWVPGSVWKGTEYLTPVRISSTDLPDRSVLLYRLSYPGPPYWRRIKHYFSHNVLMHYFIKNLVNNKT